MTPTTKPMEGLADWLRREARKMNYAPSAEAVHRWASEVEAAAPAQEPPKASDERTPQDYAIEHAEYMAIDADQLLEAIQRLSDAEAILEQSGEEDQGPVADARDLVWERVRSLRSGVYEFRKRRDRAARNGADTDRLGSDEKESDDTALLRGAMDALDGVNKWDTARNYIVPYKVRDPVHATLAKLRERLGDET
jgi:hypothetical protein